MGNVLTTEMESMRYALANEVMSGRMERIESRGSKEWSLLASLVRSVLGQVNMDASDVLRNGQRFLDVRSIVEQALGVPRLGDALLGNLLEWIVRDGGPQFVPVPTFKDTVTKTAIDIQKLMSSMGITLGLDELARWTESEPSVPAPPDISFVKASFDKAGGRIELNPARMLEELTRQYGLPAAIQFKNFCAGTPTESMPAPTFREGDARKVRQDVLEQQVREAVTREQAARSEAQSKQILLEEARASLAGAQEAVGKYMETFEQLKAMPLPHASVLSFDEKTVTINTAGRTVEVGRPKSETGEPMGICVGQTLKVTGDTMQIVEPARNPPVSGAVLTVLRLVEEGVCEVEQNGQQRAVTYESNLAMEEGDRVVLDFSASVVVKNLGKPPDLNQMDEDTRVTWDDIGGLEQAKRELQEAIEAPLLHAETLRRYGRKPSKGVLLYGGPGLGKTMLGKAAASALKQLHAKVRAECVHCGVEMETGVGSPCAGFSAGVQVDVAGEGEEVTKVVVGSLHEWKTTRVPQPGGFYAIKGPELLDKFIGETEAKIRRVFAQARAYHKRTGHPATIFVDEAEAILAPRGTGLAGQTRGILSQTVVPQFLAEMDGLAESGAFVILATNRPQSIDSAIVRDERIGRRIKVTRPSPEDALAIAQKHLQGKPLRSGLDEAARELVGALYDPALVLYRVKKHSSVGKGVAMTLAAMASGAMIAGIVDRAAQDAMRRALSLEVPENAFDVPDEALITLGDIREAVRRAYQESVDVNHEQEIQEFTDGWEDEVASITRERARPAAVPAGAS